ncbi:unnamed protein product [Brassicogethes aeneus]|uniref:Endonuclease/exonuclease/phosphatase domain-containing protein n=1 Tax=Brassicogethes aeneus TaxID=1431903 RepID=A0A9P0FM30_BRAAE|nr:unnamed protein product [Brassicogethes aeneus]
MTFLPAIICMDANAKNPIWFSNILDHRGELLESFALENDLLCINTPQPHHTFSSPLGDSNVDLTMCSAALLNKVSDWTVTLDICPSGHRMISFKLALSSPKRQKDYVWSRQIRQVNVDYALDETIIGMRAVDGFPWAPTTES